MTKTILIAGSEARIDDELSSRLSALQYRLLWSSHLPEALERLESCRPDVLLVDLDVAAEGWDLLAPAAARNPGLHIIGLTERPEVRELAAGAHLRALAGRPLDFRSLLQTIKDLLTQSPEEIGFRYLPPAKGGPQQPAPRTAQLGLCPAAYSGWGINE